MGDGDIPKSILLHIDNLRNEMKADHAAVIIEIKELEKAVYEMKSEIRVLESKGMRNDKLFYMITPILLSAITTGLVTLVVGFFKLY